MKDEVLENYIRQYLECLSHQPEVIFTWQGGEPTLVGLEFYQRAVKMQKKYALPNQEISNCLQTNGILLDEKWCGFLYDNKFLVGLSCDGPPDVHDPYRVFPNGGPTSRHVMRAFKCLKKHDIQFNVLCCVHHLNASQPRKVYRFFRDNGVKFVQFIPIVVPIPDIPGVVSAQSVTPTQWGNFMCRVFDEWIRRDVGKMFVQSFDMALSAWMGYSQPLCVFSEACGRAPTIEHNGDVFSCDHFVTSEYKLGNLLEQPLKEILDTQRQIRFALDKRHKRPQFCKSCLYNFICQGECPYNRLAVPNGEDQPLSYLCEGFMYFFSHIDPYMHQMAQALRQGLPAATVMEQF
jgi:uncharacterized protein